MDVIEDEGSQPLKPLERLRKLWVGKYIPCLAHSIDVIVPSSNPHLAYPVLHSRYCIQLHFELLHARIIQPDAAENEGLEKRPP